MPNDIPADPLLEHLNDPKVAAKIAFLLASCLTDVVTFIVKDYKELAIYARFTGDATGAKAHDDAVAGVLARVSACTAAMRAVKP